MLHLTAYSFKEMSEEINHASKVFISVKQGGFTHNCEIPKATAIRFVKNWFDESGKLHYNMSVGTIFITQD